MIADGDSQQMDTVMPIILIVVGFLAGPTGALMIMKAKRLTEDETAKEYLQIIGGGLCLAAIACLGLGFFGR